MVQGLELKECHLREKCENYSEKKAMIQQQAEDHKVVQSPQKDKLQQRYVQVFCISPGQISSLLESALGQDMLHPKQSKSLRFQAAAAAEQK